MLAGWTRRQVLSDAQTENDRIRGYLQQQAREKSIPELVERVREGVAELVDAARAYDRARLNEVAPSEQNAGGSWTGMDCLRHALGSNASVGQEILYVAHTGEFPDVPATVEGDDMESMLVQHQQAVDSCVTHVEDADPAAFLDVTWKHPMFGDLNWREWFLFMRIHSKDHAAQLRTMHESFAK